MYFIPEAIDDYAVAHSAAEPKLLQRLRRETYQKVLQPRMLSGHYQGRLLSLLSQLTRPKSILEIGTYTGYSALCLAEGLASDGILHTIDHNEELYDLQRRFFEASAYAKNINQHLGDALEIIPGLAGSFDLIFIDADKPNYVNYFNLIIDRLRPGGILISDNVLWSGKVIEKVSTKDTATQTVLAYNKLLATDQRLQTVMLPIRDGLSISIKQ